MSSQTSLIEITLAEIKQQGLNRIRCYLTGAPYATLEDDEIRLALRSDIEGDETITYARLIDNWHLKALTFNSQVIPSLRGLNEKTLVPFMSAGHKGQVKALTFLLTRLLHPHLGSKPMATDKARERMLFAVNTYDAVVEWEAFRVNELVQQMVAIDAYCAMPYWHTLWAFESTFSPYGIEKAPKKIKWLFEDPSQLANDSKLIDELIAYMYKLMLYVVERDGVAGRGGNKLSQQILIFQQARLPELRPAPGQKQVSQADMLRIKNREAINSRNELRIAHSAIHGKSGRLDYNPETYIRQASDKKSKLVELTPAQKLAKALTGKSPPKTSGKPKAAPTQQQSQMAGAFANVVAGIDFAKLLKKD